MKAVELSKWFVEKNPNLIYGRFDGNLKLNKLLYFANLMYYSIYKKNLIDDNFEKWDNGPVIREIYTEFRYNNCKDILKQEACKFDENIEKILNIINFIYMDKTSKELSDETHTHSIWIDTPKNAPIDFFKTSEKEIEKMNRFYLMYKDIDFNDLKFEIVNGIRYYYFESNLKMTDDILKELSSYYSDEKSLFLEIYDGELVVS